MDRKRFNAHLRACRQAGIVALFVAGTATVAFAQTFERPPADIEQRGDYAGGDAIRVSASTAWSRRCER